MQRRSCLRAVFVRSREAGDPGKVRGQVKAEDFGFPTSTDSSGPEDDVAWVTASPCLCRRDEVSARAEACFSGAGRFEGNHPR